MTEMGAVFGQAIRDILTEVLTEHIERCKDCAATKLPSGQRRIGGKCERHVQCDLAIDVLEAQGMFDDTASVICDVCGDKTATPAKDGWTMNMANGLWQCPNREA